MQLDAINAYYSQKIEQYGPCAAGVDWNGEASQRLRFQQLHRLMDGTQDFSINDVGCGYGALLEYLLQQNAHPDYLGVDISPAMIAEATRLHAQRVGCQFAIRNTPDRVADYTVASGIFNVRLATSIPEWERYIHETLEMMQKYSTKGFAFNCLTSYSDAPYMRDYLYYANPGVMFDYCKQNFSRNVALLHDYDLYEFTMLVRL